MCRGSHGHAAVPGAWGDDAAAPLVVDVDGSLVSGDLLVEGAARLLAASPLKLFVLAGWLAGGRAALTRPADAPTGSKISP